MSLNSLLKHSLNAYARNFKLISLFSLPFLVSFPLALLLPNFIAVSGIFLRFDSILYDLTPASALFIVLAFISSLALFAFAISAINVIVKHQRTLTRLTSSDLAGVETASFKLFFVFLVAFAASLFANFWILEYAGPAFHSIAPLVTLVISFAVLFTPQALILEEVSLLSALKRGVAILYNRFYYCLFFICLASILLLTNAFVFLMLQDYFNWAIYLGVLINALVLTPFFEVMKAQIFLSKYTLLK